MLCQSCNEQPATVHVTEIVHSDGSGNEGAGAIQEQHLCERCAESANLPSKPVLKKSVAEVWKLLQASAQRGKRESGIACPDCGMTLLEFRQRGRLGCAKDYEVFAPHLRELLERIHGATKHVGRVPGLDEVAMERLQRMGQLQRELEEAIRAEAYEDAARLRDELKNLQQN